MHCCRRADEESPIVRDWGFSLPHVNKAIDDETRWHIGAAHKQTVWVALPAMVYTDSLGPDPALDGLYKVFSSRQ